ncbi:MAG: ABC transporter substrate-binding protein, partial [Desulfobacterales bacterium]|nr:ABC transporter substrate-binding protein [Desulfobacterales bacterium]
MTSDWKRSFLAAALVVALLSSGVAFADVKIGFLGGFTGPLKSMTPSIHKAAKLAVKHVNDQGGLLDGQKIILPNADTTCGDVDAAAAAADRLVNTEKVTALVGPLCSGATMAAATRAAIPAGVTLVSPASTSPAITALED